MKGRAGRKHKWARSPVRTLPKDWRPEDIAHQRRRALQRSSVDTRQLTTGLKLYANRADGDAVRKARNDANFLVNAGKRKRRGGRRP